LGNTYHLYLRPGLDRLQALGGLHQMMNWSHPILTDSGGFQVFSLGAQALEKGIQAKSKITDEGVEFTSHLDGSKHFFSPERAIQIQQTIGADIIMAFDECTPDTADFATARQAWQRTEQWAQRCVQAWEEKGRHSEYGRYQALFGIVQGALHQELRLESAQSLAKMPFDGMAVGGETVGYNMQGTAEVMGWIEHVLPPEKPRYAMGLGRDPQDLVEAVLMGFDMFDCVGPTRLARNGALYNGELDTSGDKPVFRSEFAKGRLAISRQEYATDTRVILEGCDCFTCQQGYSRAYLHHLAKTQELAYYRLATLHNVRLMIRLTEQLRHWILS
jgi:queuine tRNA-ribosyltransferase